MNNRRDGPGGPIWLIVSMCRKDPMVFYIFVVGMIFFAFASGFVGLLVFE
jgi:hypothetical protein